jgi:hypothetical protein
MQKYRRQAMPAVFTSVFLLFVFLVVYMAVPDTAWSRASGISGYSGNPGTNNGAICTSCHSGGTAPSVSLSGPSSLTVGTSGVYTITISGGAASVGGFDVSAVGGTLQATASGTKLLSGEVTQSTAATFTGGSLSFSFTLTAPAAAGQATLYGSGLSANGNGSTSGDSASKATLVVTVKALPSPMVSITDSVPPVTDLSMPFGTVTDGVYSDQTLTVSNIGGANLVIGTVAGTNPLALPFAIHSDNCTGMTILPSGSCTIGVRFAPTSTGTYSDSFNIPSNDPSTPSATISLSGTGSTTASPHITVTDSVPPANDLIIPFGAIKDGDISNQTVTITNSGTSNLVIGSVGVLTPLSPPFGISSDNCSGKTIAPSASCSMNLQFNPVVSGSYNSSFDIPSNDPSNSDLAVSVTGTGDNSPSAPSLISPADGSTGIGTATTITWGRSTDPDGDTITYHLTYCTDSTFSSCSPITVASSKPFYYAGSGILFLGFIMATGHRGRKILVLFTAVIMLASGSLIYSCSTPREIASSPSSINSSDVSFQATGLASGTTYYWKVTADDGKGGLTESAVWSFETQ